MRIEAIRFAEDKLSLFGVGGALKGIAAAHTSQKVVPVRAIGIVINVITIGDR